VGPVDRLVQRRQIRRATEQALISSVFDGLGISAAQEGAAAAESDRGVDQLWDDPHDGGGWDEQEPVTGPILVGEVHDSLQDHPDDSSWEDPDESPRNPYGVPLRDARSGVPVSSTLSFRSKAQPWYRTKRAVIALVVGAVAAFVVIGVLVLLRSPAADVEESTTVAPSAPTSATPALTSAPPSPSSLPPAPPSAPPPPPPPPPPSAAEIDTGSVVTGADEWQPSAPSSQTDMPEIGVTRTPVTRAPISATPPPPPDPGTNSATPGDGRKRGGWGPW